MQVDLKTKLKEITPPWKKEALAMVYVVKKFRHYHLANHVIFYVDHQALVYMVNRPLIYGHIAQWLLLLLEFDLK